jgi:hypothetical protein
MTHYEAAAVGRGLARERDGYSQGEGKDEKVKSKHLSIG